MKFSILIAHYNNASFFTDCFESILKQTFTNWEVIIVDDFSTASEKKALKELILNDKRFFLYENETNRGVGYTKKKCMEYATGDICGFVDPDDALTSDALEESIKLYNNKNTVATYSQFYISDKNLIIDKIFPNSKKIKNGEKKFFNMQFEVAHFFTFRKETYERTEKIDETLTSSVDQDLYLKLYEKGNLAFIPKKLYLYRIHDGGVSQNKTKKEKLYKNWHLVLYNTLKRRNIQKLYNKDIDHIESLPNFIFEKESTLISKLIRKIFNFFLGGKYLLFCLKENNTEMLFC
ncbi:glycosyltransferase family 2 protein [Chryseobacterium sp. RP-3-3]|uniref:Glycosyltransferase family 2 protein n=1 Tax=Chryseobacterium antibioticum TaxID=2728847 RepID=A0A7Y0FRE6_9FLAO|nr:glycosyltransferase family 2 protein [Chryseobacterium antibioticum]NML69359.1 glycosyltransferase family 2 protein [Chryseobacterium antibioticum]